MKYNEYIASEGKVLLNINNFFFANRMITKNVFELIEVSKEEAEYYCNKYQSELSKQQEQEKTESEELTGAPIEEHSIILRSVKNLASTVEIASIDSTQQLKNLLKEELVFKGYDLSRLIEPIVHGE